MLGENAAIFEGIEPKAVWSHFSLITTIPRPSGEEAAIAAALTKWAVGRGFTVDRDTAQNLCVRVPASSGRETLMQRVRSAVTKTRLAGFPDVDASSGLAFTGGEDRQGADLLKLADERMYVEKQEHRRLRKLTSP